MPVFQYGKSYVWLFFVYAAFFVGVGMIGGKLALAVLSMPAMIAVLLLCELASGVALDSWWRAKYLKGNWQYTALIAWHAIGVALLSIVAAIFLFGAQ